MREPDASHRLRETYALPADLGLAVEAGRILAWRAGLEDLVRGVAADPDAVPRAELAGRAPLGRFVPPDGPPVLVRPYRKGGLLRGLRGSRFRGAFRPLAELALTAALHAEGVPVAEAVGAIVVGDAGGWEGWLLTREAVGARDLLAWLRGAEVAGADEPAVVLARAGAAARALHDAGVRHADLHAKNLLVTAEGHVLVLDLDRAVRGTGPLDDAGRLANLARFERFLAKQRAAGAAPTRWDPVAFYGGYAGEDGDGADWMRRAQAARGSLAWRRLWWRLAGGGAGA